MKVFFCIHYIISKLFFILLYGLVPRKGGLWRNIRLKIENRIFFSPRIKKIYPIIPELRGNIEHTKLITKDCVKIHAWYINPDNVKTVVVFCHGQSESISKWQNTALFLKNGGIGALFLSYRGHYKSAGLPSEQGIYNDAHTAIDFLQNKGIKTENIIFWGRSLGSSVACEMALRYNLKGIILESPIFNIKTAAITISEMYFKMINIKNIKPILERIFEKIFFIQNFENYKKLPDIKCPALIVHSKQDKKIPYHMAEKLNKLCPNSTLFLCEEGSHNTNDWCLDKVKNFIKEIDLIKNSNKIHPQTLYN